MPASVYVSFDAPDNTKSTDSKPPQYQDHLSKTPKATEAQIQIKLQEGTNETPQGNN